MLPHLKKEKDFVFLWNGKADKENHRSFLFLNPIKIISCYKHNDIKTCFCAIENALSEGFYVAGFLSYEAAAAFEDKFPKKNILNFPLLWFGVYNKPRIYEHETLCQDLNNINEVSIKRLRLSISKNLYLRDIAKIKNSIRGGNTYQVNYTFKYKFSFSGSPYEMFSALSKKQPTPYAALIGLNGKKILSFSPELFFKKEAHNIKVKPMKGTIGRGIDISDDIEKQKELKSSLKDKAENLMIVDMLRNDLGKISKTGTVKTRKLFEIEKHRTLYQMTSTIESKLDKRNWYDIFKGIFPSGSVTGAPKIKTMQIINELEKSPRNIYTGSIGYISPNNEAVFNIAIRTILLDEKTKTGELGIGSGVTIESDPEAEFNECKLKADFFIKRYADFALIETLLWQRGTFLLLTLHLKRLGESANYFNYKYSRAYVIKSLLKHTGSFTKNKNYRVRLLLNENGSVEIISKPLKERRFGGMKIVFSRKPTNTSDVFLYHKTTNRKFYDDEYQRCKSKGFADVIFFNESKEVTEGAISNIIIKKGKNYYTPPIKCGLLNGTFRRNLLKTQTIPIKEKVLYKRDIKTADRIFICNSVMGLKEAKI